MVHVLCWRWVNCSRKAQMPLGQVQMLASLPGNMQQQMIMQMMNQDNFLQKVVAQSNSLPLYRNRSQTSDDKTFDRISQAKQSMSFDDLVERRGQPA